MANLRQYVFPRKHSVRIRRGKATKTIRVRASGWREAMAKLRDVDKQTKESLKNQRKADEDFKTYAKRVNRQLYLAESYLRDESQTAKTESDVWSDVGEQVVAIITEEVDVQVKDILMQVVNMLIMGDPKEGGTPIGKIQSAVYDDGSANPPGERRKHGRLLANWRFGVGEPKNKKPNLKIFYTQRSTVRSWLKKRIDGMKTGYIGKVIYFSNYLPYAAEIDEAPKYTGKKYQAPEGMTRPVAKRLVKMFESLEKKTVNTTGDTYTIRTPLTLTMSQPDIRRSSIGADSPYLWWDNKERPWPASKVYPNREMLRRAREREIGSHNFRNDRQEE